MKNALIAFSAAALLVILILIVCLDMAKKEAAFWQQKYQSTQAQASTARQIVQQEIQKADQRNTMETVSGIYHGTVNYQEKKMDLRSDGTGLFFPYRGSQGAKITWRINDKAIETSGAWNAGNFKIEGDDLIDSQGNRWIHTR